MRGEEKVGGATSQTIQPRCGDLKHVSVDGTHVSLRVDSPFSSPPPIFPLVLAKC